VKKSRKHFDGESRYVKIANCPIAWDSTTNRQMGREEDAFDLNEDISSSVSEMTTNLTLHSSQSTTTTTTTNISPSTLWTSDIRHQASKERKKERKKRKKRKEKKEGRSLRKERNRNS